MQWPHPCDSAGTLSNCQAQLYPKQEEIGSGYMGYSWQVAQSYNRRGWSTNQISLKTEGAAYGIETMSDP